MLGSRASRIVLPVRRSLCLVTLLASTVWAFPDPLRAPRVTLSPRGWAIEDPVSGELWNPFRPPRMLAAPADDLLHAALIGAEPARWELGHAFLFGWFGLPKDVAWGEALLAGAPPHRRRVCSYALGAATYHLDEARAVRLLAEALDAGIGPAQTLLCASAYERLDRRHGDPAAARRMLEIAKSARVCSRASCALAEARLAVQEKRWEDAWIHGTLAAKTLPATPEFAAERRAAHGFRVKALFETGRFNQLSRAEFEELFVTPFAKIPALKWGVWGALVVCVLVLLGWTWRTRSSPVGLWLALSWTSVPLFANGLGILFPLGTPLGQTFDRWSGAFFGALTCVCALAIRRQPLPFGLPRLPFSWRVAGSTVALLPVIAGLGHLHGRAYEALFGVPLEGQLIEQLLRVDGLGPRLVTLLAVALAVPYAEEVAFRGFLYEGLTARWGQTVAVVGSALCFALAHIEPVQPFSKVPIILVMGVALGLVRRRSGNLTPGVLLHAANNAVATMAAWWWP
jgi:membrane protease YdiL (CAAX protease family)